MLRALAAFVSICAAASALPDPLPAQLIAIPTNGLAVLRPGQDASIYCFISLDTEEKAVLLQWHFLHNGVYYSKDEQYDVSYEPTAVCVKAGLSPEFYIAGYSQRTGQVVVEEWTVQSIAISEAVPQGGSAPVVSLAKTVRKDLLYSGTSVHPLRMIAYNFTGNRLWLFEESVPNVVWSLDVSTAASPVAMFDSTMVPQLPLLLSVKASMIKPAAPDGGGFILTFYRWRAWNNPFAASFLTASDDLVLVFRDANLDGTFEQSTQMTLTDWLQTKHYLDYTNSYYSY